MLSYTRAPKKLERPAGGVPAGELGEATLEQLWSLTDGRGIRVHAENSVSILSGRAIYLPSKEWTKIVLLYKVSIVGGVALLYGL